MNLVGLFTAELKATTEAAAEVKERQFEILLLVIWLRGREGRIKII